MAPTREGADATKQDVASGDGINCWKRLTAVVTEGLLLKAPVSGCSHHAGARLLGLPHPWTPPDRPGRGALVPLLPFATAGRVRCASEAHCPSVPRGFCPPTAVTHKAKFPSAGPPSARPRGALPRLPPRTTRPPASLCSPRCPSRGPCSTSWGLRCLVKAPVACLPVPVLRVPPRPGGLPPWVLVAWGLPCRAAASVPRNGFLGAPLRPQPAEPACAGSAARGTGRAQECARVGQGCRGLRVWGAPGHPEGGRQRPRCGAGLLHQQPCIYERHAAARPAPGGSFQTCSQASLLRPPTPLSLRPPLCARNI